MFQFLSLAAIKTVSKFVLVFMGLMVIPIYLIMWFKKSRQPPPAIKLLSRCIKYGQTLSSKECSQVNVYLKKMKNSLEGFARGTYASSEDSMLLAQAIEVLPLLHEISQPHTCCEKAADGLSYHKGFDCKSSLTDLFDELNQVAQLPVISGKLAEIVRVRQGIRPGKRRHKILVVLFGLLYSAAALLLAQAIIFDRAGWSVGLGLYLSCLLAFFLEYDYYYSREFKRHQKSLKRLLKGKA